MSSGPLPQDFSNRFELESVQEADQYLKKHRIEELFNDLCATICFKKPDNVQKFLIQELERRAKDPSKASLLFENPGEIEAVFRLADLQQKGTITVSQAQKAMTGLSNTQAQYELAMNMDFGTSQVDLETFKQKVTEVFK